MGVHMGAIWRIRLNNPFLAATYAVTAIAVTTFHSLPVVCNLA